MTARRILCLLPALAVLALSIGLTACDTSENKQELEEGVPVELGDLQYNVIFSRFLNPDDVEDREYLIGQPAPQPDQLYLGVFVQILNKSHDSAETIPSGWVVNDTDRNTYLPLTSQSPYALQF